MMPATCVHEGADALTGAIGDRQVVVPRGDARVDHRDANAGAGITVLGMHVPGADGRGRAGNFTQHLAITVHPLDLRIIGEALEQDVGNPRGASLDDPQLASGLAAVERDAKGAVGIVVEFHDNVGFTNGIGNRIQRPIELLMLFLDGSFAVTRTRGCRYRDCGKRGYEESNQGIPPPHRLLPRTNERRESHIPNLTAINEPKDCIRQLMSYRVILMAGTAPDFK